MGEEYGFDELEQSLEASDYFERVGGSFEGQNGEAVLFNGDSVVHDRVYLEDEVSQLVEELEEKIDEFSRDPSVNNLRRAVKTDGHVFEGDL